jgi:hypothetical protein
MLSPSSSRREPCHGYAGGVAGCDKGAAKLVIGHIRFGAFGIALESDYFKRSFTFFEIRMTASSMRFCLVSAFLAPEIQTRYLFR